jgi:methylated-DNA-[protein]-cysteine S-methyltransferase
MTRTGIHNVLGDTLREVRLVMLTFATMPSPIGTLRLYAAIDSTKQNPRLAGKAVGVTTNRDAASPIGQLVGVYLPDRPAPPGVRRRTDVLDQAAAQLAEYFAGRRQEFSLALAPPGTGFQRLVWESLLRIPHGETRSYGELARSIGRPSASRAVGAANGANPIPIIVPCHRLIGANGDLTGYGGGLAAKRWLLDHERAGAASVGTARR